MSDNYSTELADAIQRTAYRGHRIGIVIVIVFLLSGVIFFIDSSHNISILYESAFILALPFAFLYLCYLPLPCYSYYGGIVIFQFMCVIFIYSPSIIWLALSRISDPHIFYWDLIVFMFLAITTVISFGGLYRQYGIKETASGTGTILPFDNLYFSVVTWTTVGYGDFIPASKTSKKLAAYEAITGYITMAALFSVGVAILSGRR